MYAKLSPFGREHLTRQLNLYARPSVEGDSEDFHSF